MKLLLTTTAAAACLLSPLTAGLDWHTDLKAASERATKEQKDLFLKFTGSDWCSWCKRLEQEVFAHESFAKATSEHFIFVELDYPRDRSKLGDETIQQNDRLKIQYAVRGFPTVYLCDAAGRPYARTGYLKGGPQGYLAHLESLRENKTTRDEGFAAARDQSGRARAAGLEQALSIVPPDTLIKSYRSEWEELQKLAPDCALVKRLAKARKSDDRRTRFNELFQAKDYEGVIAAVDQAIAEEHLEGEEKQQALFVKMSACMAQKELAAALQVAEDIKASDPDSRLGKTADSFRARIEEMMAEEAGGTGKEGAALTLRPTYYLIQAPATEAKRGTKGKPAEKARPAEKPARNVQPNPLARIDDAKLRSNLENARERLAAVTGKLEKDHARWEKLEGQVEASRKKVATLSRELDAEKARLAEMEGAVATLEKHHDKDHADQEALTRAIAELEKELEIRMARQKEIAELERQAEELRKKAEELRQKAERLKDK